MTKDEVLHLSRLARIRIDDDEVEQFTTEIEAILEYVSQLNDLVTPAALEKSVGAVHNVFREDEITNTPGEYTDAIMAEAPATKGRFLEVKKILKTDD